MLNLMRDEVAFYDAVCSNDAAVIELGEETLKAIAQELLETAPRNATIDWNAKDTVRARLRSQVRRLLTRCKYPPDKREETTNLVIRQAELIASDWVSA